MSNEVEPQILSIRMLDGELFDGEFVETKKVHGRDVHILIVNGLERFVPVNQCSWWSLGERSAAEVQRELQAQMRAEARAILEEKMAAEEEVYEEEAPVETGYSPEQLEDLRRRVVDKSDPKIQGALHRIADHQRSFFDKAPPDTRIIQPGEESEQPKRVQQPPAHSSIARLPDDAPEV